MKRIGVFGGSFNPPGAHHRLIVENLLTLGCVDQLMVLPCGQRKDKPLAGNPDRKNMVEIAFADLPGCVVNTFNIDLNIFTSNYKYEAMFRCLGEVWHIVGSDQIINARIKTSVVHVRWENGDWVFDNLKFIVVERPGYQISQTDLPTHNLVLRLLIDGSSTQIREDILTGSQNTLLSKEVSSYISENGLYGTAR
ncbi:MAG: hypothetical protein WCK03_03095 [Candidatus Taylorbacteria bacterium]